MYGATDTLRLVWGPDVHGDVVYGIRFGLWPQNMWIDFSQREHIAFDPLSGTTVFAASEDRWNRTCMESPSGMRNLNDTNPSQTEHMNAMAMYTFHTADISRNIGRLGTCPIRLTSGYRSDSFLYDRSEGRETRVCEIPDAHYVLFCAVPFFQYFQRYFLEVFGQKEIHVVLSVARSMGHPADMLSKLSHVNFLDTDSFSNIFPFHGNIIYNRFR